MRRIALAGVVLVFACGVARATTFEWVAGATTKAWNDPTAYDQNPAVPGAGDTIHLGAGAVPDPGSPSGTFPFNATVVNFLDATPMTVGSIIVDCGTLNNGGAVGSLTVAGDFIVQGKGYWYGRGGNAVLNVGGTLRALDGNQYSCAWSTLTLTGTGLLDIRIPAAPSPWGNLIIGTGASYATASTNNTPSCNLLINGTITGGVWAIDATSVQPPTTGNFLRLGPSGSMTGGEIQILTGSSNTTSDFPIGGGTYTTLTINDASGGAATNHRTIRLKGDVTTTSDFNYDRYFAGFITNSLATFTTDNGGGHFSNLTVNGNFRIGEGAGNEGYPGHQYLSAFVANSSTVTVKGGATFDRYAAVQGGTSTWKFGGNVQFTGNYLVDCSSLVGTTFIMNGTGPQSLATGDCVPLGNIEINTAGGAVSLGADLVLAGNFKVTAGAFNNSGHYVIFSGKHNTQATAQQIDAGGLNLGKVWIEDPPFIDSDAILMSDLTISDNLDIDPGCKLFLNGHTLTITGSDAAAFLGQNVLSGAGQWQVKEGGFIVGAVPEPATLLLLGTGALGSLGWIRRQRIE